MELSSLFLAGKGSALTSFFSTAFLVVFLPFCLVVYSLMPRRGKKYFLLAADCAFFWLISGKLLVYLLLTALSMHYFGLWLDKIQSETKLLLAQTDGALLYHCTAGKDRVGVGTMLLLTALGVDWPVIVENYLITNERMAASTDCLLTAVVDYDLSEAEREVIRTFDRADAAFLTAARDAIAARYGSVDAFLTQALGVGASERETLRARYLTAE